MPSHTQHDPASRVAMCFFVLQCVVCVSICTRIYMYIPPAAIIVRTCSVSRVAVCCSVLQCVAVCCSVLQWAYTHTHTHTHVYIVLPAAIIARTRYFSRAAPYSITCCNVFLCVAVCCKCLYIHVYICIFTRRNHRTHARLLARNILLHSRSHRSTHCLAIRSRCVVLCCHTYILLQCQIDIL